MFSSLPQARRARCPQILMAAPGGRTSLPSFHREELKLGDFKPLAQGHTNTRGTEVRARICVTPENKLVPWTLRTEPAKSIAGAHPH